MSLIIPFFLMNRGCPHRCLFCNERLTAGDRPERITEGKFTETVRTHLAGAERKGGPVQIAFYGGTFTGMERKEQQRLLALAAPFLREGTIHGIRISTRPDGIEPEQLTFLRDHGVTTVEVGAQSLDDEVLVLSRRGHTVADTVRTMQQLQDNGFQTGIHLMAGLPGDSPARFAATIARTIELRPDTVRLHPTLVLRDTELAESYRKGDYLPLTLNEAVDQAKYALRKLNTAGIPVIRLGLQTTRELEEPGAIVAGPFHPSFRSLVETSLFREMAETLLSAALDGNGESSTPATTTSEAVSGPILHFLLSPADISHFLGPRRENMALLKKRFPVSGFRIVPDPAVSRNTLALATGRRWLQTDLCGRVRELPFSR